MNLEFMELPFSFGLKGFIAKGAAVATAKGQTVLAEFLVQRTSG
jgi:hypothetical protein